MASTSRGKRIVSFTWGEWKWLLLIIMLGVNMYWTALIVQPVYNLLTETHQIQDLAIERAKTAEHNLELVLETMENNTKTLQTIIESTQTLNDNQVILVSELGNVSEDLGEKSDSIDQNSKVLVLQTAGIQNLMDWAAKNFTEAEEFNKQWEHDDRMRSQAIQGNLSDMSKTLQLLELMAENDQIKGVATFNRTINVTQ